MSRLSEAALARALERLPDWERAGDAIRRTYRFDDFRAALAFVNRVGEAAERAGHHPDIDIRYSTVTLTLSTHDAGGLTSKDIELAGVLDG